MGPINEASAACNALGVEIMKAEIVGSNLVITVPMGEPRPSASGKTLVVASSHGNQPTAATVNGQPVIIGFNAYIKR
jgi:hypothetical protein